jgi:hypothetical protein
VTAASALVLAGASVAAGVTIERTPPSARVPTLKENGKIVHRVSNNRSGEAVLRIDGITPGQEGRRRVVLANAGPRPFRRVTLTQDHVVQGGFSDALQLQVYDAITRRCLYPRPPARLRVPRVRVEPDRCMQWMPFDGRSDMRFLTVPGKDGTATWRRGEQHAIDVRWRLASTSPNSDQGRRASFRLRWHTSG